MILFKNFLKDENDEIKTIDQQMSGSGKNMSGLNFLNDSQGRLMMNGQGSMNAADLFKMVKINLKQWLVEKDICTDNDVTDTLLKLGVANVESVDTVIDKSLCNSLCNQETMRSVGINEEKIAKIQKLQLF